MSTITKLKKNSVVKSENDTTGLSWRVYHLTDERKHELLKSFTKWVEHKDSTQLMVFYQKERITSRLWQELCRNNEEFAAIFEYGKHLIGQRREKLMWYNKINAGVALRTQRLYADDFQKIYQDDINFKDKLASKETNVWFLPVLAPVMDTGIKECGDIDETE